MIKKRLVKEYEDYKKGLGQVSNDHSIELTPTDATLMDWSARIVGPPETPYQDFSFKLKISIPANYPIHPPKFTFQTKICHPNVHFKTGEICLDVLKDNWSPVFGLEAACRNVLLLLSKPEPSSPLNCDAGNLMRAGDMRGFWSLARMYTVEFAEPVVKKS